MDTFMDKLAQKLNAQEMIRANSAADAEEMDQLKSQLREYDECLAQMPDYFIRVHQSYAVNFHYIDSFQRKGIILYSGNKIMVSRKYFEQARKKYMELCKESM